MTRLARAVDVGLRAVMLEEGEDPTAAMEALKRLAEAHSLGKKGDMPFMPVMTRDLATIVGLVATLLRREAVRAAEDKAAVGLDAD